MIKQWLSFRNITFIIFLIIFILYAIRIIEFNPRLLPIIMLVSVYLLTCKNWKIFSKENRESFSSTLGTISIPANLIVTGKLTVQGITECTDITATGNITATTGNITATKGNITATTGNITATTGNIKATGNIIAKDIEATGNIKAKDIEATGNIKATGNITAKDIEATGNIKAKDIEATGNIKAKDIEATGNIIATTGKIIANILTTSKIENNTGKITITAKDIEATGKITAPIVDVNDLNVHTLGAKGDNTILMKQGLKIQNNDGKIRVAYDGNTDFNVLRSDFDINYKIAYKIAINPTDPNRLEIAGPVSFSSNVHFFENCELFDFKTFTFNKGAFLKFFGKDMEEAHHSDGTIGCNIHGQPGLNIVGVGKRRRTYVWGDVNLLHGDLNTSVVNTHDLVVDTLKGRAWKDNLINHIRLENNLVFKYDNDRTKIDSSGFTAKGGVITTHDLYVDTLKGTAWSFDPNRQNNIRLQDNLVFRYDNIGTLINSSHLDQHVLSLHVAGRR